MTDAERVLRYFHELPAATTVDWIIERFLAFAGGSGSVSIVIPRSEPSRLEATVNGETASDTGCPGLRLFRTVLARLAKMGADEGDVEFQPYGGHVVFHREAVRIEVDFENTTVNQRFRMVATSLAPDIALASETQPAFSGAG